MTTRRTPGASLLSATLALGAIIAAGSASAAQRVEITERGWCHDASEGATLLTSDQALLAFQGDGNLVLYNRLQCADPVAGAGCGSDAAVWSSGTNGRADRICFQDDGNLVIYQGATAVWATNTEGTAFRTASGHYLTAEGGGGFGLGASAQMALGWERFFILPLDQDGKVAIQDMNSWHYMQAFGAGGGDASLHGTAPLGWEQFYLEYNADDATHSIRTANSEPAYYLRAEGGGGGGAYFDRTVNLGDERFELIQMRRLVLDGCRLSIVDDTARRESWWGVGSCGAIGDLGMRARVADSKVSGNDNFGAGMDWAFGYQVPYAGFTRAFGEAAAWGRLFGRKVTIVGATGAATTVDDTHTATASVTVMGESLPVTLSVEDATLVEVEKTFFKRKQTFMAGPIPVTVEGSATGSVGVEGSFSPGAAGVTVTMSPYADLTAGASASVGVACATAGISGEVSLVNVSLPLTIGLDFAPLAQAEPATVTQSVDLVVSSGGGAISLDASFCVGSRSWELVSWDSLAESTTNVLEVSYDL